MIYMPCKAGFTHIDFVRTIAVRTNCGRARGASRRAFTHIDFVRTTAVRTNRIPIVDQRDKWELSHTSNTARHGTIAVWCLDSTRPPDRDRECSGPCGQMSAFTHIEFRSYDRRCDNMGAARFYVWAVIAVGCACVIENN